ncbi:hypothetical protein CNEO3_260032 [Clostridium neonatale]|nr:hypothetical protein CNEO3_260032 [Clostridium neonatale]
MKKNIKVYNGKKRYVLFKEILEWILCLNNQYFIEGIDKLS